jgi:replication factor C subunit 3/5
MASAYLLQVIEPIRSRCLCIRVPGPTCEETVEVMQHVAAAEGLSLPTALANRVSESSGRSLRRALLTLEVCRVSQYPFTDDQPLQLPDWELYTQVLPSSYWILVDLGAVV